MTHMLPVFKDVFVEGRRVRYTLEGDGAVTVIIEVGLGVSSEQALSRQSSIGWSRVFGELRSTARVLMYDRAGVGKSAPAPLPRTSSDMMTDLRALLEVIQVSPPFLLVGHSVGGFVMRQYACAFPDDVLGVALVDSMHPDQLARFASLLPPEVPGEPAFFRFLRKPAEPKTTSEGFDISESCDEVRAAACSLKEIPLAVLSHGVDQHFGTSDALQHLAQRFQSTWLELQRDLLALSRKSVHVICELSGHNIQLDEPLAIVDAVSRLQSNHENSWRRGALH